MGDQLAIESMQASGELVAGLVLRSCGLHSESNISLSPGDSSSWGWC